MSIWNENILDSKNAYDPESVLYKAATDDSEVLLESGTDQDGKQKNVYYTVDGEFLGYDDQADDYVYLSTRGNYEYMLGITGGGTANYDGLRSNSKKLDTTYTDFFRKCSAVYGESSIGYGIFVKEEMYAIASVHIRNSVAYGTNNDQAVVFRGKTHTERNASTAMKTAIAGFISALQNGTDHSNGADQWDGAEQAMVPAANMELSSNGVFMYKMNVMGWKMTDEHYDSWKTAVENEFGAGKFTVPQEKTAIANYGGMKNKGKIRLYSKAQYGLSIFWETR